MLEAITSVRNTLLQGCRRDVPKPINYSPYLGINSMKYPRVLATEMLISRMHSSPESMPDISDSICNSEAFISIN